MTRRNKLELAYYMLNLVVIIPLLIAVKNTPLINVALLLLLAYAAVFFDLMEWILDSL